jgi:hypothetical protein
MRADPETEAAVMNVVTQCFEAFIKKDLDSILAFVAPDPDVILIGTGGDEKCVGIAEMVGIAEIEDEMISRQCKVEP